MTLILGCLTPSTVFVPPVRRTTKMPIFRPATGRVTVGEQARSHGSCPPDTDGAAGITASESPPHRFWNARVCGVGASVPEVDAGLTIVWMPGREVVEEQLAAATELAHEAQPEAVRRPGGHPLHLVGGDRRGRRAQCALAGEGDGLHVAALGERDELVAHPRHGMRRRC